MLVSVVNEVLASKLLDILLRPDDWTTGRLIVVHKFAKHLPNFSLRQILIHIYFFKNHSSLFFQIRFRQGWVKIEIGNYFENLFKVLLGGLGIITSEFMRGEGVILRPKAIELLGNIRGLRPHARALEAHMLKEVREPILLLALVV